MTITDFDKKISKMNKSIEKTGKNFKKIGSNLTQSISLPVLGAAASIGGMVLHASKSADELMRLSDVTGMSTTEIQKMSYAAQQLGTDFETIEGAQTKLTRSIAEADAGNVEAIKSFEALGIAIYDNNGNLKDAPTLFNEAIDALGKIEDPVKRDALAMDLMGKSARDLNPLIKAGSTEINRLKQEAEDTGAVLSEETVKKLAEFNDKMDALKTRVSVAGMEMGEKLLPIFLRLTDFLEKKIVPFVQMLIDKFLNLSPTMQIIIGILAALLVILPPLIMFLGMMAISIAAISWPVLAVIAGIVGLIAVIVLLYKNWDSIQAFFLKTWELIKSAFMFAFNNIPLVSLFKLIYDNWDSISKFLLSTWENVKIAFKFMIDGIMSIFEGFVNFFIKNLNNIIKMANIIPGVDIQQISEVDFNKSSVSQTTTSAPPVNVYLGGTKMTSYTDYTLGYRAFS
jgi:hypothetical protein